MSGIEGSVAGRTPGKNILTGIRDCAGFLLVLGILWVFVRAAWEWFWSGANFFGATAARLKHTPPREIIESYLWLAVYCFAAGAILYLVIAVFVWAEKQLREPEEVTEQDSTADPRAWIFERVSRTACVGGTTPLMEQYEEALDIVRTADPRAPLTEEQWKVLLAVVSGHDKEGNAICQKCGVSIPEGKGVLLTEDEKRTLAEDLPGQFLPGGFRHADGAGCRLVRTSSK